ncbi:MULTISPECIES: YegP family protein [Arthrobacter]|uniref:YegP family protein n=1 Tax=Arthrobacter TaxID=1663 RepID=UPI00273C0397|nr:MULTISPECIES: YegP family protein [Arthrobacter]MDV8147161.1 YegP family protein [Arthrobacter sp. B10-11]WLQ07292.1 YegP family protein [Arthrobacter oryzae]
MAGTFEIVNAEEENFYFRLKADDGTVVAVSPRFRTLKGVVAGINAVRESAATGLVVNRS